MLRIGEFAALSSISIHMLRHYDKIGLLVPQQVDDFSGYRYYGREQLLTANQILSLKSMGFGLEEIKEILPLPQYDINALLQKKLQSKYLELHKIQEQIQQIKTIMDVKEEAEPYALSIVRKMIASMWTASLRDGIHSYPEEGILWKRLEYLCEESKIKLSPNSPAMAIYHGTDDGSGLLDVEVLLPLDREYSPTDEIHISRIPEREAASVMFQGSYSQISLINSVAAEWLEKQRLEIDGPPFMIYHRSPENCTDDRAFVSELCFPVKEKSVDSSIVQGFILKKKEV